MRLTFLVVGAEGLPPSPPSAVVVHGQGRPPVEEMVEFVRRAGLDGPIVVPFGDYATTASGMEVAGPCWYRSLPGDAGTDPLTLARAVVQVSDLLADVAAPSPASEAVPSKTVLVGWRQGAAVAVGAGLLAPDVVGAVVAVDVPAAHLSLLPASLTGDGDGPEVLLITTGGVEDADPAAAWDELARRGVAAESCRADEAETSAGGENGETVAGAVARFLRTAIGRPVAEGSPP